MVPPSTVQAIRELDAWAESPMPIAAYRESRAYSGAIALAAQRADAYPWPARLAAGVMGLSAFALLPAFVVLSAAL